MLLFVVLINDPSFSPILSAKGVVISMLTSIQSIVSISGRISPQVLRCLHKSTKIISFLCWFFQQLRSNLLGRVLSKLSVVEVGIFFSILLFQWSIFYSFFRRHCDVALFTHLLGLWGLCSFRAYQFPTGVPCPLFKFFPICQVLPTFSTGVLSEIFLTPCAILSLVPEAMCC